MSKEETPLAVVRVEVRFGVLVMDTVVATPVVKCVLIRRKQSSVNDVISVERMRSNVLVLQDSGLA